MHADTVDNHFARLGRFVLGHRRRVIAAWLVLLIAGAAAAGSISHRLTFDFSLPGQPGYETAKKITHLYGNGGDVDPSIIVVSAQSRAALAGQRGAIAAALTRERTANPRLRFVDQSSTGDARFTTSDGRTTFVLVFAPQQRGFGAPPLPAHAATALGRQLSGDQVSITGLQQLSSSGDNKGPGVLVETLIGAAGALAVLAFVFGSLLALMPLLIAAVSILTTFLVVLGLTYVADVSAIVQFLISLVGLGVAIDYSLLIVTRWREERDRGRANEEAIVHAMSTAGRAVLLSGLTVAIGLLALVVLPVPGLRSVGYGGMLIPLISTCVALTLLPALLAGVGPRLEWPRIRKERDPSRAWTRWAGLIVARRRFAAGIAVAVLLLLLVPVLSLTTGETSAASLSKSGAAHVAYARLQSGRVPSGVLTPIEVLVRGDSAAANARRLAAVPGIAFVARSAAPDANHRGTTVLIGVPRTETVNSSTLQVVRDARQALDGQPGVVGLAGDGAIELDYRHAVFGSFPLMFAVIAVLTIALLARAFRSIVLAVKAVALNLLSMGAAFGLMTWFWQQGHGSQALFGIPATGAITFWLPLMVFAFLFGLSMDYEVFILSRIREEYERTGSTDAAVIAGLGRTGRLVTSAALILFLAFASLASAPDTDVKVLATGLGAGILLDATIVRALLLPALVALFGRWNWWLPRPLARVLRVPAAPLALPSPAGGS